MFFGTSTLALAILLFAITMGATVIGLSIGRSMRDRSETLREPFAVMQAALLGFMGLVLAFGLSLAVGRYENRREAVVTESNAIGTAYLRAQTIDEPARSPSLGLLRRFTDISIIISRTVPGSPAQQEAVARSGETQRQLWSLAGQSLEQAPVATAPRLYVESLNEMFDSQSSRVYGLSNRVPTAVLLLEVAGAAIALASLGMLMGNLGRGIFTVMLAAVLVTITLLVTFDLDRPTRGLITVPDTALVDLRVSMAEPPAT